ncbi:DUF418 domain-containing protein [Alkalihalobacillus macyae]|uniref:DUF418 domain-containing protein n=1 Tax=Guptibacillus hwajinpoensis TaxID=208199 RepID=UPI00273A8CA2|nr:DUF418 domain-containing protein [Alkalihalobacillus macyae]MDP4551061.1 DUF418 domain-containing protein [Alkalihalobacillus macyae]
MTKSTLAPTAPNERIHSIDAMRGLALLGIFFVNMVDFHSPWMYVDRISYWGDDSNQFLMNAIDLFAQASFYPLFSFLFGYGFLILMNRLTDRGESFRSVIVRRLLFLLVLGIIHFTLIWHGDILFTYSLCGFLLLFFIRLEGKTLIQIGLSLWLFYVTIFFLLMLPFANADLTTHNPSAIEQSILVYGSGSYLEIMIQRLSDWYYVNGGLNGAFLLFTIFPYFLFGAGFAKKGWFNGDVSHLPLIKKLLFIGALGFVIKVSPFVFDSYAFSHLQDSLGGPLVSLFYLSSLSLLYYSGRRLKVFEWIGKMALTNYLLQSILGTFLFYHYGLGLYGSVEVSTGVVLLIGFFVLQVLGSRSWLKAYQYGPVEWVWRMVTYQKRFSIKRNRKEGKSHENH